VTGFIDAKGSFGVKDIEKKINKILVKDLLAKVLLLNLH
jgi:hypothetical protein